MPRRHNQLFARIASFQALYAAAHRAIKGKRKKPGAAAFFANLEREVLALERQLRAGDYRPGRYTAFEVNDPKRRIVSAAPFRDRVVHHVSTAVRNWLKTSGLKLQRGHTSPSISWWQTSAERHAPSRPQPPKAGGQRPACVSDMSDSLGVKVPCVI